MDVTRRTLVRHAAWSAPVVAMAAAAPAFAASQQSTNNSINGWVQVTDEKRNNNREGRIRFNSDVSGTIDGLPYGLYLLNTMPNDVFGPARIEIDVLGNIAGNIFGAPGEGWPAATRIGTKVRNDDGTNRTYTRFSFPYGGLYTRRSDGRVWLGDFDVISSWYNLPNTGGITYWFRRFVTINGVERQFERRNGDLGFIEYDGSVSARSAAPTRKMVDAV